MFAFPLQLMERLDYELRDGVGLRDGSINMRRKRGEAERESERVSSVTLD
jgi:hypothetical protein